MRKFILILLLIISGITYSQHQDIIIPEIKEIRIYNVKTQKLIGTYKTREKVIEHLDPCNEDTHLLEFIFEDNTFQQMIVVRKKRKEKIFLKKEKSI